MSTHPRRLRVGRRWIAVCCAAGALVGASCAGDATLPDEVVGSIAEATTTPTTAAPACPDPSAYASMTYPALTELPAPGAMPDGTTMADIQARGQLVVGVSADTLLFGSRNPLTGNIEGFDIDVLKTVARAIFGDGGEDRIVYKVITYAQRLPSLEAGTVDIVAHTMTINCNRWLRIAFSSVYYQAGQKVLVKDAERFPDVFALSKAGARVCAPEGSTNIDEISKPEYAGIIVVPKPDISDCLVAMQQGQADATTGDDTVLAGFAAQDPSTEIVGEAFTGEPYGLGMNRSDVDLVQFVNAVLDQARTDGTLEQIARTWLVDTGALDAEDVPPVPEPDFTRPLP
jgi:polar amino acid transport system substrate-binding protein